MVKQDGTGKGEAEDEGTVGEEIGGDVGAEDVGGGEEGGGKRRVEDECGMRMGGDGTCSIGYIDGRDVGGGT